MDSVFCLAASVGVGQVDLGRAIPHFRHISLKERSDQVHLGMR